MSAQFILRYAGAGVRISNGVPELVRDDQADKFVSEADAWLCALKYDFNPAHATVVNYYLLQQAAAKTN